MKQLTDIISEGLLTSPDPTIPGVPDKYSRIPVNLIRIFNTDDILEFRKLTHLIKDEATRLSRNKIFNTGSLRGEDNVYIGWFGNNIATSQRRPVQDVYSLTIYYGGVLYGIAWDVGRTITSNGWDETYRPKFVRLHKNVREWMFMPCRKLSPEVSAEIAQALEMIDFEDYN